MDGTVARLARYLLERCRHLTLEIRSLEEEGAHRLVPPPTPSGLSLLCWISARAGKGVRSPRAVQLTTVGAERPPSRRPEPQHAVPAGHGQVDGAPVHAFRPHVFGRRNQQEGNTAWHTRE
jgi:hypothetical protein